MRDMNAIAPNKKKCDNPVQLTLRLELLTLIVRQHEQKNQWKFRDEK